MAQLSLEVKVATIGVNASTLKANAYTAIFPGLRFFFPFSTFPKFSVKQKIYSESTFFPLLLSSSLA
jgi:hypothetical protein